MDERPTLVGRKPIRSCLSRAQEVLMSSLATSVPTISSCRNVARSLCLANINMSLRPVRGLKIGVDTIDCCYFYSIHFEQLFGDRNQMSVSDSRSLKRNINIISPVHRPSQNAAIYPQPAGLLRRTTSSMLRLRCLTATMTTTAGGMESYPCPSDHLWGGHRFRLRHLISRERSVQNPKAKPARTG